MEDEAQKMVALKKAYADIILNTAKEAAARIMVSERKALRFQQDLSASRDEALRMLLRLKQMVDSKTTESELKSSSQQRRIDELEAQLQEAEDVITDLRAELKSTEDELERMKRNQVHGMNEFPEKFAPFVSPGCETMATSDTKSASMNPRVTDDKCCSTMKQTEKLTSSGLGRFDHPGKPDLASIIMRSKKPELYRNGCTQRIRAFERNSLNGKLPPEDYEDDENFPAENNDYATEAPEVETTGFSLKSAIVEMDRTLSQGERKKPGKVCTFRRRKTRFGKAKTLRRSRPSSSSSSLHCKPSSVNGNGSSDEDAELASDGTRDNSRRYNGDEFKVINKGKRKRNVKSGNGDGSKTSPSGQLSKHSQPSHVLSRCRTFAYLVDGGIKSIEDRSKTCENEDKVKSLTRLDPGLTLIKRGLDSVDFQALNKPEPIQNDAEKNVETVDDSGLLCSEIDAEVVSVSSPNCGVKENVKASESKPENNRLLKYTFQRKRKKEAISGPDETASAVKISVTKKASEEFTAPESEKSGLVVESSRDSRRLAQVARQLISLSGKRWQ